MTWVFLVKTYYLMILDSIEKSEDNRSCLSNQAAFLMPDDKHISIWKGLNVFSSNAQRYSGV